MFRILLHNKPTLTGEENNHGVILKTRVLQRVEESCVQQMRGVLHRRNANRKSPAFSTLFLHS